MTTNLTEIESQNPDGTTSIYVIIDNGDGSFTSMAKAYYEELEAQRKQSGTLS